MKNLKLPPNEFINLPFEIQITYTRKEIISICGFVSCDLKRYFREKAINENFNRLSLKEQLIYINSKMAHYKYYSKL